MGILARRLSEITPRRREPFDYEDITNKDVQNQLTAIDKAFEKASDDGKTESELLKIIDKGKRLERLLEWVKSCENWKVGVMLGRRECKNHILVYGRFVVSLTKNTWRNYGKDKVYLYTDPDSLISRFVLKEERNRRMYNETHIKKRH
jgi:hypothetical protein